jgi:RNA polymerase sigma-70 factor (ECF subfamily)
MPQYKQQEIITGCPKNKRPHQEYLYQKYYSLFLKICMRYAQNRQDAEQLLHDGFLKIFGRMEDYNATGSFEGWMKKIMVNTCLDYLKSSYLKEAQMLQALPETAEAAPTVQGYNAGLENLAFKELAGMIQSLPPIARTVFNLFVFEGYTHKEIAETLQIKEGTSYWHLNQARTKLQQLINTEMN